MSGFAAVIRFDGRQADAGAIHRMTEAMAYRGPDGIRHWQDGPAALGHCMMYTTAESLSETQPHRDESGTHVMVMDGWLANPEELLAEMTARGVPVRGRSDAELVLKAWQAWGDACCDHIDGEFAFVVWDAAQRRIFAARDHVGLRPLHWHWDGKRLLIASDIAGVLAAGDFEPRLNPGMVAEHVGNEWHSLDETLWQGVMRLPPASAMHVDARGPRVARYWMPPLDIALRYPRDEDYQEHYRELLADSVRRASRTHLPLACEVSGGLDSSAVYALAVREQRLGRLPAPELRGYTYLFPPGGPNDEMEYAEAVERHLGTRLTRVEPFLPDLEWFAERARQDRDMPLYPNAAMAVAIGAAVTGDGARVVLNGEGGDAFLGGGPLYFAEHLREGDMHSLVRSAREDAEELGWRVTARSLLRFGLAPLLPASVRQARRAAYARRPVEGLEWLSPSMRELIRDHRMAHLTSPLRAAPNQRGLFQTLTDSFTSYVYEFLSRKCARDGYECRSPLASRVMVEFAFSTPQRQRRRGEVLKHIHREALVGLLPESVVRRRTKATFNPAFERLLDNRLTSMISTLPQCGIDWLDSDGFEMLKRRYAEAAYGYRPIYELWALFGVSALQDSKTES